MNYSEMPKLDLHCHLDGSINLTLAQELLRERGEEVTLPELRVRMQVPEHCTSLEEYLKTFALPLDLLQTEDSLRRAAFQLAMDCAEERIVYLEARFAPMCCREGGLTAEQAIRAVCDGLAGAQAKLTAEGRYFRAGVIVCAMRHMTAEENSAAFRAARELLGCGVVGVDMAGAEAAYPNAMFRDLFAVAVRLELPITIHSGETGNRDNIREAVAMGARRIGHGTAMQGDRDLEQLLAERHIGVEQCPTSNLQTRAIPGISACPVREFLRAGVPVTLNTDNRTVSGITLTHEWSEVDRAFSLTREERDALLRNAIETSFADDEVKEELARICLNGAKWL